MHDYTALIAVLGVIALFVLAGVVVAVLRQIFSGYWDRKKLLKWVKEVEALDDDAILTRISTWDYRHLAYQAKSGSDLALRAEAAYKKINEAAHREEARMASRWIAEESSPGKKAEYLLRFFNYDPRLVAGVGKKAYARLFFELLDQALARGRVGMLGELEYYHSAVSGYSHAFKKLAERAGREVSLPEDWDNIVLSQYKNPPTYMFDRYADLDLVDVRTLAGQALVARDVAKAKVALAYCTNSPSPSQYSEAVTDALKGDLILLIEGHEFSQHD